MILPDYLILERLKTDLVVEPFNPNALQPASLDVHLDCDFLVLDNSQRSHIDVKEPTDDLYKKVTATDEKPFILHPGEFALGCTLETVGMPNDLVSQIEGKSSLARLGLVIHSTAGFIDPGFEGQVTLELSNMLNLPITLYPNMPIGQLTFIQMAGTGAQTPYGTTATNSKYKGQRGPTPSQYWRNFQQKD